jgi:multiple sugar transport system substrate-binding protein
MADWGPNGLNLGSPTYKNGRKLFNADNNDMGMAISGLYQAGRIRADNPDFYNSGEWMVILFPQFEDAVEEVVFVYYGYFLMVNS